MSAHDNNNLRDLEEVGRRTRAFIKRQVQGGEQITAADLMKMLGMRRDAANQALRRAMLHGVVKRREVGVYVAAN